MMSIRRLTAAAFVAVLVLAGCQADLATGPVTTEAVVTDVELSLLADRDVVRRPFKGSFAGTMVTGEQCGESPWQVTLYVEGEGRATHIGKTHLDITTCWDLVGSVPVGEMLAMYTVANGDEVWLRVVGPASPGVADYEIYGGTGRFEGADGLLHVTGQQYPDFTWTTEAVGWIAY